MYDHTRLACRCPGAEPCESLCFEIKPKWGFLPVQSREWPVKLTVDRFTMHQVWKKHVDGSLAPVSRYRPLDLFSRDRARVLSALRDLAETPHNNFRVFKNGRHVFPGDSQLELCDVVKDVEQVLDALADILHSESVLSKVQRAQNVGGEWDIEAVWPYFNEMLEKRLTLHELYVGGLPHGPARDCVEIVRRFLISCTARDCSIMIALSRCPSAQGLGRTKAWEYDIAVCDLDSKPLGKMRHYFEIDRDICAYYTRLVSKNNHNNNGLLT